MKKLLLSTFTMLLLFLNTFAQKEIPEPNLDEMLVNIDKSNFTSGILYDKVMPLANLMDYDKPENNISDVHYFEQALHELYRASNKQKFSLYKDFRKKYSTQKNVVDMGIINATFHKLNYNEKNEKKGALKLKGGIFEQIGNKPVFLKHHVLIISPLKRYLVGSVISYNFDNAFLFEETKSKKIVSLKANFGTNKTYTIYKKGKLINPVIDVTYLEAGYKTLKFTAVFSDGTSKETKGILHIKLPKTISKDTDPLIESFTLTSTIPYKGYSETTPIYGQLEYRIFYHTNNGNTSKTLLKPIIIIDGFDPQDRRKIQDSDSPRPANEHHSIEEMMFYYNSNHQYVPIIPKLRTLGYDVVIVNHPTYTRGNKTIDGGADYIERNAMNHVTLYKHLNSLLQQNNSTEKLVIVGPSMGGQISRYALSYMEKHNIDHNARLWISIDSPHLGANIPMGIQSIMNLLEVYGGSVAAADFYHKQLKSTASNQQLIEQHRPNHTSDYLNGGSPVYQQYYANLKNNGLPNSDGFPQNLRRIAIVNGSITGVKNGVAAEEDFRIHGFVKMFWWNVKVVEMNTKYMPNSYGTKQVARLWRLFKPLRTATYTNINPHGSMDIIPGGYFNSEGQLHNAILGQSVGISDWSNGLSFSELLLAFIGIHGDYFSSRTNKEIHSFIPTVSALAIKNANFNWGNSIDYNVLCNDIPFDSYFGPKNNEQHTSFTERSVNWLLEELAGNPQLPPTYGTQKIAGKSDIYLNANKLKAGFTETYSIPKVAKATSYTWNLDFKTSNGELPWKIISGQGTNTITVKVGTATQGKISSSVNSACSKGKTIYKYVTLHTTQNLKTPNCDSKSTVEISPNPSHGKDLVVRVIKSPSCKSNENKDLKENTITIYDMKGNVEYTTSFNTKSIRLNQLKLNEGLHIIYVITADGVHKKQIIIIKK